MEVKKSGRLEQGVQGCKAWKAARRARQGWTYEFVLFLGINQHIPDESQLRTDV
jgi:hypothetical protein